MNPANSKKSTERCLSDDIICCGESESDRASDSCESFQLSAETGVNTTGTTKTITTTLNSSNIITSSASPGGLTSSAAGRRGLVHSVSIIVEPAISLDGCGGGGGDSFGDDSDQFTEADLHSISHAAPTERRKTIAGPIVVLEDFYFDQPKKAKEYDDVVQSLFASARLRKEEFARLLEEHAQIVSEIKQAQKSLT